MRIPSESEGLVGKICVCSVGRPAIVTAFEQKQWEDGGPFTWTWLGIGLDGKGTWASTNPAVVAETAEEFRQKLNKRFNGKMSHHG